MCQADCIYFTDPKFKRWNKGFKYLLVIIDCYTKFVWLRPLKTLTCNETKEAFIDVFSKISPPKLLQTDQVNSYLVNSYSLSLTFYFLGG